MDNKMLKFSLSVTILSFGIGSAIAAESVEKTPAAEPVEKTSIMPQHTQPMSPAELDSVRGMWGLPSVANAAAGMAIGANKHGHQNITGKPSSRIP